jgi:predicted lysophospholipase L1 biosynthesis ABC-type transport system permease subunit
VISAEAARLFFGDDAPLGRRLVQDGRSTWTPFTVVGIVGNVQHTDPRKAQAPFVYAPLAGDFRPFEPWVTSVRPDIPVAHIETMSDIAGRATAQLRLAVWLLALAAAMTLVLSVIGTYGVMAYVVTLRRNEFGIRMALGADGGRLRAMVLRQGALTTAAGLLAGLAGALGTARLLRSLLFGIAPTDPSTYAAAACALALIALAAVYVPARRASHLDPAQVLRAE